MSGSVYQVYRFVVNHPAYDYQQKEWVGDFESKRDADRKCDQLNSVEENHNTFYATIEHMKAVRDVGY